MQTTNLGNGIVLKLGKVIDPKNIVLVKEPFLLPCLGIVKDFYVDDSYLVLVARFIDDSVTGEYPSP